MIKLTILYPNADGAHFDMDYYLQTHVPMSSQLLSPACKGYSVDEGVGGAPPGAPPPYLAITHLVFDSIEAFIAAFMPHAEALQGDIPKFTNTQPIIQFSEIRLL